MDANTLLQNVKTLVGEAKHILLVTHGQSNADSIGSTLACYLGLKDLGKVVSVVCPQPMQVELSGFIGADVITTTLAQNNFVISLDYIEGSIDKVSYNIEGSKFNLVIEPRFGFPPFSKENVQFSQGAMPYDLIITIDTRHLGELTSVYEKNKTLFAEKLIINIDCHKDNANYGKVNIVDPTAATTAELVAVVLSSLGTKLTEDIASNLLNALYLATDNFKQEKVNTRTFEVASVCMKAGGKRFTKTEGQTVVVGEKPKQKEEVINAENIDKNEWLKPKMTGNDEPVSPGIPLEHVSSSKNPTIPVTHMKNV